MTRLISTSCVFVFYLQILFADRTVRRLTYKLDSDVTAILGENIIDYELTRIDSHSSMSILEIETEQWVHDCCLVITTQPSLRIRLQNENNYPKITAYLQLRTPLSSISMRGTGNIRTRNRLESDSLVFESSGTSNALLHVEISTKIDIILSGSGEIVLEGRVRGLASIRLTGTGRFDGRQCPMSRVIVGVSGIGTAYVIGEQAVDVGIDGVGHVYYHGPLRNQHVTGVGSIHVMENLFGKPWFSSTEKKSSNCFNLISSIILIFAL